MDRLYGLDGSDRYDDRFSALEQDGADMADMTVDDNQALDIGTDERRMQVRAYNHWVSLLNGRAYPAIEDLDPESIIDFGPHSVLLDFTAGIEDPAIRFLGASLREECHLDADVTHIGQVPGRSLLSRLTDHYLQIIANCAPIGFEAEFTNSRGHNTMYRGILMPFSSDNDTIDFIYGVINWKELVSVDEQAALEAEVAKAVRAAPPPPPPSAIWADGPSAGFGGDTNAPAATETPEDDGLPVLDLTGIATVLADQLMLAQQSAAAFRAADTRSRAALYRALGRAYDFAHATAADPTGFADLLNRSGLVAQARAPMTPIVKLVFGLDYDKTRVTEFATVLSHAAETGVPEGGLIDYLDSVEGGIKGVVKAARSLRRPVTKPDTAGQARRKLAEHPVLARIAMPTRAVAGDYVLLLARADGQGSLDIVASIDNAAALTDRAIRLATA